MHSCIIYTLNSKCKESIIHVTLTLKGPIPFLTTITIILRAPALDVKYKYYNSIGFFGGWGAL